MEQRICSNKGWQEELSSMNRFERSYHTRSPKTMKLLEIDVFTFIALTLPLGKSPSI